MNCNCFFCKTSRFSLNKKINLPESNWTVYEDNYVFITPDIAPVIKGHFLIVSKEHINSFGNGSRDVFTSVEMAKTFLIKNVYNSDHVLFFEHGAVIPHTAGGCIDHAHLHAIPLEKDIDIDGYISKFKLINTPKIHMTYEIMHEFAEKKIPYIFYEYAKDRSWIRRADQLPSQFFRLLVSHYYPKEYNWKLVYESPVSKKLFTDTLHMTENGNQ